MLTNNAVSFEQLRPGKLCTWQLTISIISSEESPLCPAKAPADPLESSCNP